MRFERAFTLIELLLSVAILLILAGIGIFNWQKAVTKAKVARVRSDFQAIATAVQFYKSDTGTSPRMRHVSFYADPNIDAVQGIPVKGILSPVLSTPIAYLTAVTQTDPFTVGISTVPLDEQFYTYQVIPEYQKKIPHSQFWAKAFTFYGNWRLISAGPDQYFDHNFINSAQLPYDPTNGLVSMGNIFRSENHAVEVMPPIPDLLAEH